MWAYNVTNAARGSDEKAVASRVVLTVLLMGVTGCSSTSETSGVSNNPATSQETSTVSSSASDSSYEATSNEATEEEGAPQASEETLKQLQELADKADEIDLSKYTSDSYENLLYYGTYAYLLLKEDEISEADAQDAIKNLQDSIDALEEKPAPVELSGSGDDFVEIPSGYETSLVHAEYSSGSNFAIWTCDESMNHDDLLVNTIGSYSGTTTTALGKSEDKYLEITASGPWTITLSQLGDMPTIESGTAYNGDYIGRIDKSATKLTISNEGESNFVVRGVDSDGKVNLLVNEIGSYAGTVPNRSYFMVIVESSGSWTITW